MLTQDVLSSFDLTLTLSFEKERELFCELFVVMHLQNKKANIPLSCAQERG